jgi:hypothetical protein
METLIQQASRLAEYKADYEQGMRGPFEGTVVSITAQTDTMGVRFGPTNSRPMPIQHPFVGTTSWLRSVPEINTQFLMQNRFDTNQPEALKTIPPSSSKRSADYLNQTNTYRTLSAGEHDFSSSGLASSYYGRRGHLDMRSGHAIKRGLNRDTLSVDDSAPTHVKNLLLNTVGKMGDEERLGIVKRWTTAIDHEYVQDENKKFKAEHYLHILNPAGSEPAILLRRIEGQVYDDAGDEILQSSTNLPLRHQSLFYTTTDEYVSIEIDENGNQFINYPSTATTGHEMIIPNGNYRAEMINRDITLSGDETVAVSGNIQYQVQGGVNYDVVESYNIVAGGNAFTMDVTPGQETVGLVNPNLLGFQAENTSDGGLTSVFGPKNSGIFLNGMGQVQIQDGLEGGALFAGDTVAMFNAKGGSLSIGDTVLLANASGTDFISIDPDLVQISSGKDLTLIATTWNANVGTVFLGNNAVIPAILGLAQLAWQDTHFHISASPGDPTTPPVIPSAVFTGTPLSLMSLSVFIPPNI